MLTSLLTKAASLQEMKPVEWEVTYSLLISIRSLVHSSVAPFNLRNTMSGRKYRLSQLKRKSKVREKSHPHSLTRDCLVHTQIYTKMAIGTFVFNTLLACTCNSSKHCTCVWFAGCILRTFIYTYTLFLLLLLVILWAINNDLINCKRKECIYI